MDHRTSGILRVTSLATLLVAAAAADATDRIVTGPGGGGPHVQTFDLDPGAVAGTREASFFAYNQQFRGGVTVAGGIQGSVRLLVTGAATAGAPHVRIFDASDPADVKEIAQSDRGRFAETTEELCQSGRSWHESSVVSAKRPPLRD